MKCRFDYTRKYEFLIRIFIYLLPVSPFVIMTFSFQETSVEALQILIWVIFTFLIGIVLAVSAARSGVIRAESDKLSVSHFFLGRNILIRNIPYENVEYVLCQANAAGLKRGNIAYELVLAVKIKDMNEMNFIKNLKFKGDFPVRRPEKFNKYIDEQPLMKMCKYINERLDKNE